MIYGLSLYTSHKHKEAKAMSATQKNAEFDSAKAEAFAGQLLTALNYGSLCLMASIGHRTGLFDTMRGLPPSTSAKIAQKAELNER